MMTTQHRASARKLGTAGPTAASLVRAALLATAVLAASGCGRLNGSGSITFDELVVADCNYAGGSLAEVAGADFGLNLNLFSAERWADVMILRVQAGTSSPITSDGVLFSIGDVTTVELGPQAVGPEENIEATFFLHASCVAGRPSVSLEGTIDFVAFEDDDGDGGPDPRDRIAATLSATGEDGTAPDWAVYTVLELEFDMRMVRGRPSRTFPIPDPTEVY